MEQPGLLNSSFTASDAVRRSEAAVPVAAVDAHVASLPDQRGCRYGAFGVTYSVTT